jgi:hypothetical protein
MVKEFTPTQYKMVCEEAKRLYLIAWRQQAIRPASIRLGSFGQPPGLPEAPKPNRPFSSPAGSDRKGGTKEQSKWERLFAFELGNFRRQNRRLPSDPFWCRICAGCSRSVRGD